MKCLCNLVRAAKQILEDGPGATSWCVIFWTAPGWKTDTDWKLADGLTYSLFLVEG